MIEISCNSCGNHCCGKNPFLTPILLPYEEVQFRDFSERIKTVYRNLFIMSKKENGICVLLDDKTMKCTNYENRPLECRLYPFLLDFKDGFPNIKLDKRFCPSLSSLKFDYEKIMSLIRKQIFTSDWIKAYESLYGY